MAEFVHLHVHSQYSMLDGAIKLKELVKRTAAMGMPAVAVTDHANMFGALTFYKVAKEACVRAIFGAELDVFERGHVRHLPLLAATEEGYRNLIWLVSRGHIAPAKGAPLGSPSVDFADLAGHTRGLVALTGCMGGVVSQAILEEGEEAGSTSLASLREIFEPGSLFVELQDHGLPEQRVLGDLLLRLAKRHELPVVATNDVHYASPLDADAHLYLSCIKTGRSYAEARERHHGSREMYLKSQDEMAHTFRAFPEAIQNTLRVAEMAAFRPRLGEPMLPSFQVPEGYDLEGYFRHVSHEGLGARFSEFRKTGKVVDEEAYRTRLELELNVITGMKFSGYFLIVWDFIRFAKEDGVPVGPGRGSGAGSLVAYALRITDLDPIPYNLLFERFLNPERVSMPDFDIDFCMDRRDRVIAYVQSRYGETSVGQIATFAELKSKSVLKDVARAMGITPTEAQALANLIPRKTPAETYTIAESLEVEPKLKARYDTEPTIKELLTQAEKLEGLTRHAGKHAAGIVISDGALWDHVPVFRDEKTQSYVTQYYKDDVEQAGLVKFDFLGLKTLTVIDIAVRLINERPDFVREGKRFDPSTLPLDDKATYQLLTSGETKGVFQLESSGMQQLFKDLRADCFEDIVAAVALYRPGPLGTGMVADFVNRKHGRAPIGSMHPLVDELLRPTYGVIVYQEQVMQIAQKLAGYTLGGADLLRRAMGKKKPEEMAKQKGVFVSGAKEKGVTEADAERIFGLLEYFAGYGFNKSHSAAYALITYQTAYLKAHYPVELLCAIMTSDKERIEKVVRTIADARSLGIRILPPDINESSTDFRVIYTHPLGDKKRARGAKVVDPLGPEIRFGLGAVRGLGELALESIFEVRREGGRFFDMFDFAARVDAKKVNRAVFEALISCGAFDVSLAERGLSRARAFASIETALERLRLESRDRVRGQTSLFGLFDKANPDERGASSAGDYVANHVEWDRHETLVREKQALGFYISGHPLERYIRSDATLAKLGAIPVANVSAQSDWAEVRVVGMVEGYRERVVRDGGGKIAFFEIEDRTGRANVKLRSKEIDLHAPVLTQGGPVLVGAKVSFPRRDDDAEDAEEGPREPTLLLTDVKPLSEVVRAGAKGVVLRMHEERVDPAALSRLRKLVETSGGAARLSFEVHMQNGAEVCLDAGKEFRVEVSDAFLSGVERIFGEQVAELR